MARRSARTFLNSLLTHLNKNKIKIKKFAGRGLTRVAFRRAAAASTRKANLQAFSTARAQPSTFTKPLLGKLQQVKTTRNYATEAKQVGNIKQVIGKLYCYKNIAAFFGFIFLI